MHFDGSTVAPVQCVFPETEHKDGLVLARRELMEEKYGFHEVTLLAPPACFQVQASVYES